MTKPRTLYDLSKEDLEQLIIRMNEILKEKFKPEPYFNPYDYLLEYRDIDYLDTHDTDVIDILKDMIRRAEKNE